MSLIECVPNFSEGRRPEVVQAIRDAIAAVPDVSVLDVHMDASHHRSVITFVAPPETVGAAAFEGIREAQRLIDLNVHRGCHPRLGAADVVPFVPLHGATMDDCVRVARALGERVGEELGIPVYLYEHAATRPERRNLADVRRGGFEGLRDVVGTDPSRAPDFGPGALHPTCGAVAIGARDLLVAYNVYLGPAANLEVARQVARAVRGSSGGLRGVKAIALEVDGQAQVSMNLVDPVHTTMHQAFELVRIEAEARGVAVTWSEIVGLVPEGAIHAAAARHLRLPRFGPERVLESRIRAERGEGVGGARWLDRVAAPTPAPGVGSVAAWAGALAAAVAAMAAGVTAARGDAGDEASDAGPAARDLAGRAERLRHSLARLAEADTAAYSAVAAARRLPDADDDEARARREAALAAALLASTHVPRDVALHAAEAAAVALEVLRLAPPHLAADAYGAVAIAEAAASAAEAVVRANAAVLARHARYVPTADVEVLRASSAAAAEEARAHRAAASRAYDASSA